jgi:3-deoxy-manno-octulosonate cytidylyltransferase (CMP-KDO synthetase)
VKGKNLKTIAIIPARYKSTRLPGKPLLDLAGKPVIQHVYERTLEARTVGRVIVATDDERILSAVTAFGGEALMTSSSHETGTDRIAEAARSFDAEIVVNVQGDEPLIDPATIDAAVRPLLDDRTLLMSTTCEPLGRAEDLFNPNVVKVVMDESGKALYFSRAPVPFPRAACQDPQWTGFNPQALIESLQKEPQLLGLYRKHTGLYVYRRNFLLEFTTWPRTALERAESLEQLRALERGHRIHVVAVERSSIGIDTLADLARARIELENRMGKRTTKTQRHKEI